jgi:hypothetical protein
MEGPNRGNGVENALANAVAQLDGTGRGMNERRLSGKQRKTGGTGKRHEKTAFLLLGKNGCCVNLWEC